MPKGDVPTPYMVALILAIIVIAVIAYMFFTHSGIFVNTASAAWCQGQKISYCLDWGKSDYNPLSKPNWDEYAKGCTAVGVPAPQKSDCNVG